MEQLYMLPILYCQYMYYACWCPGNLRSQGTSRYDIDQISWNILSLASGELTNVGYRSACYELTKDAP